jgi:hypothetical protein
VRGREEIRRDLERLDAALTPFTEADPEQLLPGVRLMQDSLADRREELVEELSEANSAHLFVSFDGRAVMDHSLDVEQLVRTLGPFQSAVASVGQALGAEPTTAGVIQQAIRDDTALRLVSTLSGSFVLALDGPSLAAEQLAISDLDEGSLFERSVMGVLDVLDAAGEEGYEERIVESVAALGIRVISHFKQLAQAIAPLDSPTEFTLQAGRVPERRVAFDRTMADRLDVVLSSLETTEETVELAGRLVGADMLRRTFALKIDDAEVVRGTVDADVVHRIEDYFNKECRATLRAVTTHSTITEKRATKYTLLRFAGPLGD